MNPSDPVLSVLLYSIKEEDEETNFNCQQKEVNLNQALKACKCSKDSVQKRLYSVQKRLQNKLNTSNPNEYEPPKRILLFIHGYNNAENDVLQRVASVAHTTDWKGEVAAFWWKSQNRLLQYTQDKETALCEGRRALIKVLQDLLKQYSSINIIAHSMGNLLLIEALQDLIQIKPEIKSQQIKPFNNLFLVAADVKRKNFNRAVERISKIFNLISIYTNEDDIALIPSSNYQASERRAGLGIKSNEDLIPLLDVDEIDCTHAVKNLDPHGYFFESPDCLADAAEILNFQNPASKRTFPKKFKSRSVFVLLQFVFF